MSIRDETVELILAALDTVVRIGGGDGRRQRVENGIDAILARYAVVELPEPDEDGTWMRGSVHAIDGEVEHFIRGMSSMLRTPKTARALAAALLAAANRAEAQQ